MIVDHSAGCSIPDCTAETHPVLKDGTSLAFKVLDHGYVKFIDRMGSDETVVEAARMSTGKGFNGWEPFVECPVCGNRLEEGLHREECPKGNGERHLFKSVPGDAKLLEFLYKNAHMSPFEQCELAIEVQAPLMVFREWHRHRTGQYNEFSGRYAQMPNLHYLPEIDRIQKQSTTNKQGSAEAIDVDEAQAALNDFAIEQEETYQHYDALVKSGVAKEVARLNTPLSRYSKMRAKMNLRNWFQFLNLRMRPNAQWEIRQYALAVAAIIQQLWPRCYALFVEYDLHGVRLSKTEALLARKFVAETQVPELTPEISSLFAKLSP